MTSSDNAPKVDNSRRVGESEGFDYIGGIENLHRITYDQIYVSYGIIRSFPVI